MKPATTIMGYNQHAMTALVSGRPAVSEQRIHSKNNKRKIEEIKKKESRDTERSVLLPRNHVAILKLTCLNEVTSSKYGHVVKHSGLPFKIGRRIKEVILLINYRT